MSRSYIGTSAYKLDEYERYAHDREEKQKQNKQLKKHERAVMCRFLIVSVIAVFAVCSALVYTNVMMIRAATQTEKLRKELALITEQNSRKQIEIGQKLDMKVIEERAINELGMQRPENNQIVYVDIKQNSYSETADKKTVSKGILATFKGALDNVLEYFGK